MYGCGLTLRAVPGEAISERVSPHNSIAILVIIRSINYEYGDIIFEGVKGTACGVRGELTVS